MSEVDIIKANDAILNFKKSVLAGNNNWQVCLQCGYLEDRVNGHTKTFDAVPGVTDKPTTAVLCTRAKDQSLRPTS